MAIVYVDQQGATIHKDGGRLRVMFKGQSIFEIPIHDLEQLQIIGNVQITTQAVALLLREKVDVVFLNRYGKYLGRLLNNESRHAERRHAQLRFIDDEARSLPVARAIVSGKINNQRVILQRRADHDPRLRSALTGMLTMLRQCESAATFDQLRGYEGKAAAYYFEAIRTFFDPAWGFTTRQFHPSPDPANALLSLVYSKLRYDVEARIQLVGLDSYLGVLHPIGYDRPGLALDLMEEFRPTIADVVVLELITTGAITLGDFERTTDPEQPVRMTRTALKTVTAAYETRMADEAYHPLAGGQTNYRRIIELQVRRMARVILKEDADYEPYRLK
jgi:CRISP-associated protein Cas1